MKKIMIFLFLFLLLPAQTFAATLVPSTTYYVSYLDQYRMDYGNVSSDHYQLYFVSATGEIFTGDYAFAPTGIHYLTCNGTYKLNFFNAAGTLIAETQEHIISGIVAPTCSSYADGISGKDTYGATYNPDGSISWTPSGSATNYEIWKDGAKVGETPGGSYPNAAKGSYSIIGKDSSGAIVGQSDINVDPSSCDVCKKLSELLQCPDWNTYMGEFTRAMEEALPSLQEWEQIAGMIGKATIDQLKDYNGPVPVAPTQAEIDSKLDTTLPTVDAGSTDAENLVPTVPPGYEQPIPFDITTGPQIEIEDDSQPFQIFDPLSNITHDEPGGAVIPGDPRNNTGGITPPAVIAPYPVVTPQPLTSELPNNPVPIPSSSPGSVPVPTASIAPGTGPIPVWKGD